MVYKLTYNWWGTNLYFPPFGDLSETYYIYDIFTNYIYIYIYVYDNSNKHHDERSNHICNIIIIASIHYHYQTGHHDNNKACIRR